MPPARRVIDRGNRGQGSSAQGPDFIAARQRNAGGGHRARSADPESTMTHAEVEAMIRQVMVDSHGQRNEDWGIDRSHTPFTDDILDVTFPRRFNMPTMNHYTGRTDLIQHLMWYSWSMNAAAATDPVKCIVFPIFF